MTQSTMPHRMSSSTMGAMKAATSPASTLRWACCSLSCTSEDRLRIWSRPMMNCVLMARQSTRMSTRIAIRGQPMAATAMLSQTVSLWTCSRLFSMPGSSRACSSLRMYSEIRPAAIQLRERMPPGRLG